VFEFLIDAQRFFEEMKVKTSKFPDVIMEKVFSCSEDFTNSLNGILARQIFFNGRGKCVWDEPSKEGVKLNSSRIVIGIGPTIEIVPLLCKGDV